MKTPFVIRQAIYSLDPNRHFSADIPFRDYLLSVIARSSVGIPVPEKNIELFRQSVRFGTRSFFSEPPPLDDSWLTLAERLARMVRDIPVSPLPVTVDEEEAWRKMIFTYPPGRYAILKSGARLAGLATAMPTSTGRLIEWAQAFRGSRNPFDCLIAATLSDAWNLPENEAGDLDSLLWSPTNEAFQAVSDGNTSKLRALLAAGLDLGEIRSDGKTLGQRLFAEASTSLPCLQLLKEYEPK
ncbi:MAG: hypothetical protein WCS65_18220 [Verrucomicrobiae bacterium]